MTDWNYYLRLWFSGWIDVLLLWCWFVIGTILIGMFIFMQENRLLERLKARLTGYKQTKREEG